MKAIDLFCGVGGLSLGLKLSGIEILVGMDNWDQALNVYQLNHKHDVVCCDLADTEAALKTISNYSIDMIAGGPPCQDFSHAGKRIEGKRANLTLNFAKVVTEALPKWFIMENVDRSQNSATYSETREILQNAGYGLTETILDASYCGVPQKRKRFFCIGKLNEINGFLFETIQSKLSKTPMTIRQYLGNDLGLSHYYRHPRNYCRRAVFSIDEPSPTIRGVNRPIPKGYTGHPNDEVPVDNLRPLTTLERARLQTFPKNYAWNGSKTEIEQFIGNAVPVNLAKFVGDCVMNYELSSDTNFLGNKLSSSYVSNR